MRKFLIISNYAPPAMSGAALQMYNLLRYFPPHSFSILTSHSGISGNPKSGGYWLQAPYHYFDTQSLTFIDNRHDTTFQRFKVFLKKFWVAKFLAEIFFLIYLPCNIVRQGRKSIAQEHIEVLLGYSDHGPALFSTYLLHILARKPYHLFFYDLYAGSKLPFLHGLLARLVEPRLFRSAEKIFVISEALAEYYTKKYGREVVVFHNSVPVVQDRPNLSKPVPPFKIMYTGSVYWAQLDALQNLIAAVEGIQEVPVELWLYTPHDARYLRAQGIVESKKVIFAHASPGDMPRIQRSASMLVVLLGFKTGYPLVINTSSPGKTYEYMLSGRPILIHAPKESYIAQYAARHEFAKVVGEDSSEELKQGIISLLIDRPLVDRLVENAWRTARQNHNDAQTAAGFQKYFM